jgi:phosphate-selective porin OprO/OprP
MATALLTVALPGYAQSPPTPVTAGFDNGFFIQSADGENRLGFGLVTQIDGRFSTDDPLPITNGFVLRKLRPTFTGRFAKYFEFKVMPDFGSGTTSVQDAFIDVRFSRAFRVRTGKDKTPIGYEIAVPDANVYFPERALASSLVPNRDIGIQALGDLAAGRVAYAAGLFNGIPDGTSSTTDADSNSDKDFAGRVSVQPFRSSGTTTSAASGLGFYLGGSTGTQANGLPYFSYAAGATADGRRTRITPAAFYFVKSFGAFGEYVLSTQEVARLGVTREIANHAMEVTTTYFLTGEPAGLGTVRPKRPFDPGSHHWGAVQLLARYSHLEVDGNAFVNGLAATGASRRADQWTGGLNWFPSSFIKWYATVERTTFDQNAPGARPIEHVIIFRAQLAF